jgi:hypothetical protein
MPLASSIDKNATIWPLRCSTNFLNFGWGNGLPPSGPPKPTAVAALMRAVANGQVSLADAAPIA